MEEVIVTRYWMALVLGVMLVYVIVGFIGMRMKSKRNKAE
jgi:uncharacterized membrane protein SirB2